LKLEIDETLPDFFYKFTNVERCIEMIKDSQLWFSSPQNFNDPFDCNINLIDFQPNEAQIKMVINDKFQGNRKARREEIQKNKRNAYRIRNQFAEQTEDVYKNSGVCCFSEKKDSILLWSHYADNHKGICVKFKKDIEDIATMTGKVQYRKKYERASFFDQSGVCVYHLVFTKSNEWKYENEIRCLRMLDNGKTEFDIKHITEIIFGCKTNKVDIQKIKKLIRNLKLEHIKFSQAKQTKSSFKLKFE